MSNVKPIPDGYSPVTPYLIINGAEAAIAFYKKAFGAEEVMRLEMGDRIGHAEIAIGGAKIMLADECTERQSASPQKLGGTPVSIHLYVPDVDATVKAATAAGAKLLSPVEDMFYGDRSGTLTDPFGHIWNVATHIRDVSEAEMAKQVEAMKGQKAS